MEQSDSASSTSLAPGFRFHPTDEELVSYYLQRKVCGKPFRFDAISEIDIYKVEPWDLPGLSKLKSRDLEWYFFSSLDKKYGNGSKTNRATNEGYWKTTGKDRPVHHRSRLVGMKKTLVFHHGRAPRGKRTNWVMHEYKLTDEALKKIGSTLDVLVLCRIFQKSGTGPKNGEKYGAPFVDEEWEDDNVEAIVPGNVSFEEPSCSDEAFLEHIDIDQDLDLELPENVSFPGDLYIGDSNNYVEDSVYITGSDQKCLAGESEYDCGLQVTDDQKFFDLPVQAGENANVVKIEHMAQPEDTADEANELFLDFDNNIPLDDGQFLDSINFLAPDEENPLDCGIYGPYWDDGPGQYQHFDSSPEVMGSDPGQSFFTKENLDDETRQIPSPSQPKVCVDSVASSSEKVMDVYKPSMPDIQNRLLGNIPTTPAFASEMPTKDMAARLSAAMQSSSSSVHMTAGMIRITNMTSGLQLSFDKTGNVNVLLSFDLPQGALSSKAATAVSRGYLYLMFFWVFVFAVSFKIGTFIYAK